MLADRIALMLAGRIQQDGLPRDFYEQPATSDRGALLRYAELPPRHRPRRTLRVGGRHARARPTAGGRRMASSSSARRPSRWPGWRESHRGGHRAGDVPRARTCASGRRRRESRSNSPRRPASCSESGQSLTSPTAGRTDVGRARRWHRVVIRALLNADWNSGPSSAPPSRSGPRAAASASMASSWASMTPPSSSPTSSWRCTCRSRARHELPVGAVLYSMPPARWPSGGLGQEATAGLAVEQAPSKPPRRITRVRLSLPGAVAGADTLQRGTRAGQVWPTMVSSFRTIVDERLADFGMELAVEYKPREMLANADAALRLCDAVDRAGDRRPARHRPRALGRRGPAHRRAPASETDSCTSISATPPVPSRRTCHPDGTTTSPRSWPPLDDDQLSGRDVARHVRGRRGGHRRAEAASRFGHDAMVEAAHRARADDEGGRRAWAP